nr:MAG TPA: hypothetical protein [Caudoviricetes sp.]
MILVCFFSIQLTYKTNKKLYFFIGFCRKKGECWYDSI